MQLLVAYDDKQYYFLDTVNVSKVETLDAKYELKYLLALLNSKLINHWYCNKYRMPTIGLYELHSIPIKYAEKSIQKQIVNLVDIILKSDDASDKNRTKTLIDNMIYELYNLTQEEIIYLED